MGAEVRACPARAPARGVDVVRRREVLALWRQYHAVSRLAHYRVREWGYQKFNFGMVQVYEEYRASAWGCLRQLDVRYRYPEGEPLPRPLDASDAVPAGALVMYDQNKADVFYRWLRRLRYVRED